MAFSIGVHKSDSKSSAGNYVVIYLDKFQLSELICSLESLRDEPTVEHLDYFSSAWGDGTLTLIPQEEGAEPTHRLKIAIVEE